MIQVYLLAERPIRLDRLFLVAKGPDRGQPLSPAGLRTIFRYHRDLTGITGGHHTHCGTRSGPHWPRPAWIWR